MNKKLLKSTLALSVTFVSTQLFAGGFALNEQSISGMGTGFAGRSSSADDASTVYGNPAGMSRPAMPPRAEGVERPMRSMPSRPALPPRLTPRSRNEE